MKDKLSNLTIEEITNLIYSISIKEIEFIAKNIKKIKDPVGFNDDDEFFQIFEKEAVPILNNPFQKIRERTSLYSDKQMSEYPN